MKKLILTNLENFDELEADQYKLLGPWCLLGDVEKEYLIEDCNFEPLFSSHISFATESFIRDVLIFDNVSICFINELSLFFDAIIFII